MNTGTSAVASKSQASLLSRLILQQTSNLWDFHAAWFRFVDGSSESLSQSSHKHMLYELHYVLAGQLDIYLPNNHVFCVKSGHFAIIPPQTIHRIVDEQPPSIKLVSGFSISSENPQVLRCLEAVENGICRCESATLRQLIITLQTKMESSTFTTTTLSPFLVQSIVLEMLEIIYPYSIKQQVQLKTSINDDRVEMAQKLISNNLLTNITGMQIADQLGISLRHLNRLCNVSCGCSINQLILKERIQKSRILLETSSFSLTDISEMIGYSSVYAFIRAFKSVTGITPGRYQKDISRR